MCDRMIGAQMDLSTLIAGITCNALAVIRFEAYISIVFSSRDATFCLILSTSLPLVLGLKLYALEELSRN